MKTIYKYKLAIEAEQTLHIPGGNGTCLLVADQGGELTIWFEVETDKPERVRTIRIVGTGKNCERVAGDFHLGSAIVGDFVWHVYSPMP